MAVAEHEEAYSSYWLLTPFKLYAYWWSFVFAYFSGERSGLEPKVLLMKCQYWSFKALMLLAWGNAICTDIGGALSLPTSQMSTLPQAPVLARTAARR